MSTLERIIKIKVTTGAKQQRITKTEEGLEVKLTSHPVKGKANNELMNLLSEFFGVPKNYINIIRGIKSQHKVIRVKLYE